MSNPAKKPITTLFDFTKKTAGNAWSVQDDTVMGGRSEGNFSVTEDGNGRFYGHVSLENGGGFSSIRHEFAGPQEVTGAESFQIRLKGDGKDYTLRVKFDPDQQYYHEASFPTKGEKWETVAIPFSSMQAVHHGEPVDVPNYAGEPVVEFQFLIGNKKEQNFEVIIDAIEAI